MSRPELEEALLLLRKAQEDADTVKKLGGIGKHAASRLTEGETLRITQIDGGVQLD
ncbi:MAG: hypothetical protein ACRDLF_11940 [Solirubrobacteraceae bacterium]